ncbi:hypothetical protein SCLCIDRAFT_1211206 [Scleroderma citrinum Foug A]|uniref:Uncharacterized protein n=1 Tax=Scleroderma citrinum Foug A TaxID=1036808 RepID=A0A0C3ANA2_9AGAM|nr:hypothetical protein SCLCIDRAFT_1211206 [Scleroderma citrinum Foug A]
MSESSQVLRISRIELQNAGKVESAQLTIGGSQYEVQKQRDSNIPSAEFSPPLEAQEPFYLSLRKKWVWEWSGKKISFDPREVLSKLEDHQFRKVQGNVTIVLDITPPTQLSDDPATSPAPIVTQSGLLMPSTEEILRQCPRFRILVIGKTGVGKTSLINSTFGIDDARPEHDKRGKAKIETPLYSKLNDLFVLHDSQGFEPGENNNLSNVKEFIERRKTHEDVKEQLHAVWLSFQAPLETLGQRLMEAGMEEFLRDKSKILGDIPTIFVFTKYDTLAEDIERRWILSKRKYSEEDIGLEADQYLKRHCIQRIQNLTNQKNIPYIAVSSKARYAGTLKGLTELTHQKVSEYFVQRHGISPVPTVTVMAQRVVPWLNIEESINVGKRKYWRAVFAGAHFSGYTIEDCLDVIHTDIAKVWNFYDPSGFLLCGKFRGFMMRMVDTLNENPTKAIARSNTLLPESGIALVAMLPITLPFSAGAAVIKWAHATYERIPEVQRKFMAYITDLTHVMDIIFTLTVSRNEKKLAIRIIKAAIVLYQTSQRRRDVHIKIKELPIERFFGGCDINAEMESIVKSRYTTDDDLKDKVEKITSAELEGDEDWELPHGGDFAKRLPIPPIP